MGVPVSCLPSSLTAALVGCLLPCRGLKRLIEPQVVLATERLPQYTALRCRVLQVPSSQGERGEVAGAGVPNGGGCSSPSSDGAVGDDPLSGRETADASEVRTAGGYDGRGAASAPRLRAGPAEREARGAWGVSEGTPSGATAPAHAKAAHRHGSVKLAEISLNRSVRASVCF